MQTDAVLDKVVALADEVGAVSGLGVVYHDLNSPERRMNENICGFCRMSLEHPTVGRYCRFACCNAVMQSFSCGEPFYTQCWAGLLFVTVAIAPRNRVRGGISVGGFLAAEDLAETRQTVGDRLHILHRREVDCFLRLMDTLKRITPSALRGAGLYLMEAACSSGLNSAAVFARQNERYRQQREIAEAAADLRSGVTPPDVLADTYQLVNYLGREDRDRARQFVSRYLARLLTVSNWDLDKLKAHLRVLLAVVTSQAILRGESWSAATSRELRFMNRLERAGTTEESCYEAAVMLQSHFGGAESGGDGVETASLSERVTAWLQAHFAEKVSARDAARAVGASLSKLTHQLPRETGKSFRTLLMEVRIAEAKRLLATTTLEVRDIAGRCGFFDQSHFTKAFKETVNLTPGQFRKLLKPTAEEVSK
jgi:AraC-like DNA-binding protein